MTQAAKIDAWAAWVIDTVSTLAFYILGAAALHPQNLIGVAISTVYLSRNETDPRVKGGTFSNVMMWIAAVAICLVGGVGLYTTLF